MSRVPTVIVLNNLTGQIVTRWGVEVIEQNPYGAVDEWKKGLSGLSVLGRIGCSIS